MEISNKQGSMRCFKFLWKRKRNSAVFPFAVIWKSIVFKHMYIALDLYMIYIVSLRNHVVLCYK